uniref:Uncharacterized protein n=1 Tax=Oryza sativa subsp. japonica TaxID=39947 RepID=Q5Z5J6_ORYSJ|nr:hypothetical protein [Oryza sativa Japonica Group]
MELKNTLSTSSGISANQAHARQRDLAIVAGEAKLLLRHGEELTEDRYAKQLPVVPAVPIYRT